MKFAKITEQGVITTTVGTQQLIDAVLADGFKVLNATNAPSEEVEKYKKYILNYIENEEAIDVVWEIVQDTDAITADIDALNSKLSASDYKVTKSYEYVIAGVESPYNLVELHEEREAIRIEIRELEELL